MKSDALLESFQEQAVSLLAIDQYRRVVSWGQYLEPLSVEERERLVGCLRCGMAARKQKKPDQETLDLARRARDRLIEAFQPLVFSVAWRYTRWFKGVEVLELVQEGNLRLLEQVDHLVEHFD